MVKISNLESVIESRDAETFQEALDCLKGSKNAALLLSSVLPEDWHESHEDIVFDLGLAGNPDTVEAIAQAVVIPFQYLVEWGNLQEFQRKCTYALAKIGTEQSRLALVSLSENSDPHIREYAQEGLSKWPL